MFDQTQMKQLMQAAEQGWNACPHQSCLKCGGCPNEQNIAHQTREEKKCVKFLIECLMAFKFYQTRPNTIKHNQTRSNSTKHGVQMVKAETHDATNRCDPSPYNMQNVAISRCCL